MATCSDIADNLSGLQRTAYQTFDKASGINGSISASSTPDQITSALLQISNALQQIKDLNGLVATYVNQGKQNNCDTELLNNIATDVKSQIANYANLTSQLQTSAQSALDQAKKATTATEQATTSENNAGTGTPGTAGQGADALQEVTVTGRKTPQPTTDPSNPATPTISPPGATGPKTIPSTTGASGSTPTVDPLQEVTITSTRKSISGAVQDARSAAASTQAFALAQQGDWRVRLSLAPAADYLYMASNPGILAPLKRTNGIVFPYTPSIQVSYLANYDQTAVQHSNYKIFQYQNSSIEQITIGCDFTAQDIGEANYILAVIHFLRSVTKMFYGQDENPKLGTPPPLCYLYGLGQFQFSGQSLVINSFNYALPTDVDYIRADAGVGKGNPLGDKIGRDPSSGALSQLDPITGGAIKNTRLNQSPTKIAPGGVTPLAALDTSKNLPTYVPTKINIQFTAYPVVTRNDVSRKFSLTDYATGNLILGDKGAFW